MNSDDNGVVYDDNNIKNYHLYVYLVLIIVLSTLNNSFHF